MKLKFCIIKNIKFILAAALLLGLTKSALSEFYLDKPLNLNKPLNVNLSNDNKNNFFHGPDFSATGDASPRR